MATQLFKTQSLSQGRKGLTYTVALPTFTADSPLGNSTIRIFKVAAAGDCPANVVAPGASTFTSTPLTNAYKTTPTPVTEYWCLKATLGTMPDVGTYTNTGSVTGNSTGGSTSASDPWNAVVTTAYNFANQVGGNLTFTYDTFR